MCVCVSLCLNSFKKKRKEKRFFPGYFFPRNSCDHFLFLLFDGWRLPGTTLKVVVIYMAKDIKRNRTTSPRGQSWRRVGVAEQSEQLRSLVVVVVVMKSRA